MASKRSSSLELNLFGASGYTSILNTNNLFMKADHSFNNMDLFLRSKPTGVAINHQTNWDFSLKSDVQLEYLANGDLEFSLNDYSTNLNDTYFKFNQGKFPIEYTLSFDWNINDVSATDDIAAVAISNWSSTEKIILDNPLTRLFRLVSIYTQKRLPSQKNITWYPVTYTTTSVSIDRYQWQITAYADPNTVTVAGDVIVTYDNGYGTQTTSFSVPITSPSPPNLGWILPTPISVIAIDETPTYTFTGTGTVNVSINKYPATVHDTIVVSQTEQDPIPPGAVQVGEFYYFPTTYEISNQKISRLVLKSPHFILDKDPGDGIYIPDTPINEYFDYSDIFFEVKYSVNATPIGVKIPTDVTNETATKVYKFGGYIKQDEFFDNTDVFNSDYYVKDDEELKWYILLANNNKIFGVSFSSYIDWTPGSSLFLTPREYFGASINDSSPELTSYDESLHQIIDQREIIVDDIKMYKIINFPNCGKVDLYTRSAGTVESILGTDTLVSNNHGLVDGDRIKMTSTLSSTTAMQTNLLGTFYVVNAELNTFKLSYYQNGSAIEITDLKTVDGIIWTKVNGPGNWKYVSTLYSPCGKNGYSTQPVQLIQKTETATNAGDSIYTRAVEYTASIDTYVSQGQKNYSENEYRYPQGYFDGRASWNNFYPFQRFENEDPTVYGIINGNKFGQSIKLKKYSDTEYILMVTEPGAIESFQITNYLPIQNKRVIPSYLPYGRIHFYKLTKAKLNNALTVEYLKTVSKNDNPWSTYEINNFNYKKTADFNYENLFIDSKYIENVLNKSTNNYWLGGRYTSWIGEYKFDQLYNTYMPNIDLNPYEFGYLDWFGKSADFSIENNKIYCIASTNVKNANFNTGSRIIYLDTVCNYFTYDITTQSVSNISSLVTEYSDLTLIAPESQKSEYYKFGNSIIVNGDKVFLGWGSTSKNDEFVYYYKRSGSSYILKQTIVSQGNNLGFGEYIVSKDDFLLTNKLSYYDDQNNTTTSPLNYIQVYRYYDNTDVYSYKSRVSPTIDLTNPIYADIDATQYENTKNLSYDNTYNNSATYNMSLNNKYDIQNGLLILRDLNELVCFQYDSDSKSFKGRSHQLVKNDGVILNTDKSALRAFPSYVAATFDTKTDYDIGQFSSSIQIIDASSFITNSELLYGMSMDVQNPEYLPIFIKNVEGYGSGQLTLNTVGQTSFASGINTFLKVIEQSSTGVNLFLQPPYPYSTGLNLYIGPVHSGNYNIELFLANKNTVNGITLHTYYDPRYSGEFPLTIYNPLIISEDSEALNLFFESTYTGVPNGSSIMPLNIQTFSYDDYADGLSLIISENNPQSSGALGLITYSENGGSGVSNNINLFVNSEVFTGSGSMPLFIDKAIGDTLNLIVYNKSSASGINLYTSGITVAGSGIGLFSSGTHTPINIMRLFTKGKFEI